ncbi:hypothetical protein Tco_0464744 [Tanacetum coccineum]
MVKPVWNNAQRVNHQNFAKKTHPCAKKNLVPRAVLMKSGLVSVNTARQVNAAHSKTTVNAARPMGKEVNTARSKAVVNAVKGYNVNAVKASAYQMDQGVIDSGCSRHMIGNMSYFTDYEEIDGGYIAFGGNPKGGKITGKRRAQHKGKGRREVDKEGDNEKETNRSESREDERKRDERGDGRKKRRDRTRRKGKKGNEKRTNEGEGGGGEKKERNAGYEGEGREKKKREECRVRTRESSRKSVEGYGSRGRQGEKRETTVERLREKGKHKELGGKRKKRRTRGRAKGQGKGKRRYIWREGSIEWRKKEGSRKWVRGRKGRVRRVKGGYE